MPDTKLMAAELQRMATDIKERLIPNAAKLDEDKLLSIFVEITDYIMTEMQGQSLAAPMFHALQIQRSIVHTMHNHRNLITIHNPEVFYTLALENAIESIERIVKVLQGGTAECLTCPDKQKCDKFGEAKPTGGEEWVSAESVH